MDVAKYIGLFLLKNEQCYVNGLGTLQLLRKAATYDGHALQPASYEITLAQGGNVDESLANYIANNEQVSITKAANALKDFSTETRNQLQAGIDVTLPHLGKFTMQDNRIGFVTAPQLQFKNTPIAVQKGISLQHNERPPVPHQKFVLPTAPITNPIDNAELINSPIPPMPQVRQYMQQQPEQGEKLNWARIIFVLLLLVVMAGGTYYGYQRYMAPKKKTQEQAPLTAPETVEEEIPVDSAITDSTELNDSGMMDIETEAVPIGTNIPQAPATQQKPADNKVATTPQKQRNVRIQLFTTDTRESAYKKKNSLIRLGNRLEVEEEDQNTFNILVTVRTGNSNDEQVADSIAKLYNAEGVLVR